VKRALFGAAIGLGLTAVVSLLFWWGGRTPLGLGVAVGGSLGTLISAASAGAQVALVQLLPRSNASLAAMVAGFAAKGLALAAGILVLRPPGGAVDVYGFAIGFLVAALVTNGVVLSALLPRGTSRTPPRSP
jgi:hypothetical protein